MASHLLKQWFPPSQLAFYYDSNAWAKGTALYLAEEVQTVHLEPDGNEWVLAAEVQGRESMAYTVSARMRVSEGGNLQAWRSTCNCPVGRMCKHGAALGVHVAMQCHPMLLANPSANDSALSAEQQAQQRQARALQQSEYQVRDWLGRLATAGVAPSFAPGFTLPNASTEAFLYCLAPAAYGHKPVLNLTIMRAILKRDGEWGKPKKVSSEPYPHDTIWQHAAPNERAILNLFKACPPTDSFSHYGFTSQVRLIGMAAELLLKQCSDTGRLVWEGDKEHKPQKLTPMRWHDAPELLGGRWQAVPAQDAQPEGWQLHLQADREGLVLALSDPPLYADPTRGLCGPLNAQGLSADQLQLMSQAPVVPAVVANKFQTQLMERLGPMPLPPCIQKMPEVRDVLPVGVLRIFAVAPQLQPALGLFQAQLHFDYAGHQGLWSHQQVRVTVGQGAQAHLLWRDLTEELRILDDLEFEGFDISTPDAMSLYCENSAVQWFAGLENDFAALRELGLLVQVDADLQQWLRIADDVHIGLSGQDASDGSDGSNGDSGAADTSAWFDLSLGMDIEGQRVNILPWVPDILKALSTATARALAMGLDSTDALPEHLYLSDLNGPGYVKLPTGKIKPWLNMLMELHGERGHDWNGDDLRLSRMDALRTAASLGEGARWQGASSLLGLLEKMRGQAALTPVPLPEGLQATLRPYQQQGLNWLQFLREHRLAGILADDMGLGKTLQTLAHILTEKQAGRLTQPALIVAPVSLLGNWQREAQRFCPALSTHIHHGLSRHETVADLAGFDVVITAYSLLSRDRDLWLAAPWHLLVLDEAQNIKNAHSQAAQVVGEIPAVHRLCLSGTPIENHLGELWSQFHFLMPGFLGSQKRFTELFRNPIERQGNAEKMAQLRARITPFMLRRTKDLVASELPPKIETLMPVPLQGQQADLYETIRMGMEKTVRDALHSQGLAKSQITILDALLKLRQVCCDPRLLKLSAASQVKQSAKLEQLLDMLPEMVAEGRKILLFSQFTQMLGLIEEALPKLGIDWVKLTGQSKNRDAIIDKFTSGQVPLFLISLKAGGVGLNLPQADTVIHYDPWWNPAVENQATDRAHRIGQKQSVWVVKLVAQGTIEERMLALQTRKAQLANDVYAGAVQRKEPLFGEADLNELFKPLDA